MICNVCGREIDEEEAVICPICEKVVCPFCHDGESCDICNGSTSF